MQIAIVILNWNGRKLLEQFLPTVLACSEGGHVYVADNASDDDSVSYLRAHFPEVTIIQNDVNGGFARGYNEALHHVKEELWCLLNSDVEVTPGWLAPVKKLFTEMPDTAIAQPKILDYKKKSHFEYAGAAGGFIDRLGYPFCRGRIFQSLEEDKQQYNDVREIFWATGACLFIKASVYRELKGFDEDYFAHQEEIDLCWRAHNKGYKIRYTGHSSVYHVGGATLDSMNPKKTFFNFRNSLYSITKNLPKRKVFPLLIARLILDGVAGLHFLFQGKPKHFIAIIRSHLSYYKNFIRIFSKRDEINKDFKYFNCTSIVWSYFVYKKKLFNQITDDEKAGI
ncbi:glycosyltransferase family 2 protein [Robertkochia marina]|uniref:Glycosyltransferase family 2 protein n=1 Tax=Robertkochia marina TaxID=1227945 RepID=A0A4S3M1A1_9FLAO|nr:glycosyltransferase family 2 protein [Robertkochia marina]THD67958.1 glycosyltransferase family 2 protein [Robertkochia marina]TRZ41543.1 glycosyltransferase family 2 protein [Robertkochia marina]